MNKAERFKRLRLLNDLTMEELAKKLHVSKSTIYKYENSIITNIPSDKIEMMSVIFNVSPSYLLGWVENDAFSKDLANKIENMSQEDVDKITKLIDIIK
jgi:transcriptional regulator with XRE-family HTH domain